jgi:hypothetical protein
VGKNITEANNAEKRGNFEKDDKKNIKTHGKV